MEGEGNSSCSKVGIYTSQLFQASFVINKGKEVLSGLNSCIIVATKKPLQTVCLSHELLGIGQFPPEERE